MHINLDYAEPNEHPIARAIREQIQATMATQRGRPWTPVEFTVGHALPHSQRERSNV